MAIAAFFDLGIILQMPKGWAIPDANQHLSYLLGYDSPTSSLTDRLVADEGASPQAVERWL